MIIGVSVVCVVLFVGLLTAVFLGASGSSMLDDENYDFVIKHSRGEELTEEEMKKFRAWLLKDSEFPKKD